MAVAQPTSQLTVAIPVTLHRQFKATAVYRGRRLTDAAAEALRGWILNGGDKPKPRKP